MVLALPELLNVGTTISRQEWPAHVTLASSFVVDESGDELARAVNDVFTGEEQLSIRFAGTAAFGPHLDVAVQLVDSPQIFTLHKRLADRLESMRGFAADEPAYWRAGYRPHMTHTPSITVHEGEHLELRYIVIAEMTESSATVVSALALAAS